MSESTPILPAETLKRAKVQKWTRITIGVLFGTSLLISTITAAILWWYDAEISYTTIMLVCGLTVLWLGMFVAQCLEKPTGHPRQDVRVLSFLTIAIFVIGSSFAIGVLALKYWQTGDLYSSVEAAAITPGWSNLAILVLLVVPLLRWPAGLVIHIIEAFMTVLDWVLDPNTWSSLRRRLWKQTATVSSIDGIIGQPPPNKPLEEG